MADNETPTYEKIKLEQFAGTYLKQGEVISFSEEIMDMIDTHGATLLLEEKLPLLATLTDTNRKMSMFPVSYPQTVQIEAKDATRDKMLSALYQFFRRICLASESELCAHALAIKGEIDRYSALSKGSVTEQNSYVRELCSFLTGEANVAHTTALGLLPLVTSLNTINNEIRALFRARNIELGDRISKRGGKTMRMLRGEACDVIKNIIETANVVYEMQPSEITENIMKGLRGIITKYKAIAAHNKGTVPIDGEDETPDPTPTPDEGDDEGEGAEAA